MKRILLLWICLLSVVSISAQHVGLKNNLIYDATLTPNLGVEIGVGKKATLEIGGGYNPFKFNNNVQFKHWMVQPEIRHWFCEKFNGTFLGFHLHGGEYSVSGIKLPFDIYPNLNKYRYEGYFLGGGVSLGYQWILSKRWNLEASIGGGYAYIQYDQYNCPDCGPKLDSDHYNYFGVTRATLSLIYFLR